MEVLRQDLKLCFRLMRRNPAFSVLAITILGVGIGANTAIFSIVHSVLLKTLPYPDAHRLVAVQGQQLAAHPPLSWPQFVAWREQKDIFESVAAYFYGGAALTGSGQPEQVKTMRASASLLRLLGVNPEVGREFQDQEDAATAPPVVMLSHSFWAGRYQSDPAAIGKTVVLNDQLFTIIGVLPEEFHFGVDVDMVMPLRLDSALAPAGWRALPAIGKLRPGTDSQKANQLLRARSQDLMKLDSTLEPVYVTPLQDYLVRNSRPLLRILEGAVLFVLLIACANTANLFLGRISGRSREIAVRLSIGASRVRIVRQLITESTVLSLIGAAIGTFLAWTSLGGLVAVLGPRLPRGTPVQLDPIVLAFTLLVSVVTGVLFGLAPSFQVFRADVQQELKQVGRHSTSALGGEWLRGGLIVAEIGLTVALVSATGLLLRSFALLLKVDKGFDPHHVVSMRITPSQVKYPGANERMQYLQAVLDGVKTLPGTKSAGFVSYLPLSGHADGAIAIEGRTSDLKDPFVSIKQFTSGDYFQAMGIPLLRGRYFTNADNSAGAPVAVINQSLANLYFPGKDPIGKRIDLLWGKPAWAEIVGVVGDVRQDTLEESGDQAVFVPYSQKPELMNLVSFNLAVRSDQPALSALAAIRDQVQRVNKDQALSNVRTMDEAVALSVAPRQAPLWIFGVFSGVALFLATIGVYGVLSYYVLQRRDDVALRMALGAQVGHILKIVLVKAFGFVAAGALVGALLELLAARVLSTMLFGVRITDPRTLFAVLGVLCVTALIACAVPALRACRVDPLIILRRS